LLYKNLKKRLFELEEPNFEAFALDVFRFQAANNTVYGRYVDLMGKQPDQINSLDSIPFLPISFFKTQDIRIEGSPVLQTFRSSGTTESVSSEHHLLDEEVYQKSILNGFEKRYGSIKDFRILALLPSYLEREDSSLVYMFRYLMEQSNHADNGFYLSHTDDLKEKLNAKSSAKTLLVGVTFALLNFAEDSPMNLKGSIVMETGGMKGRREELTRAEVHTRLQKAFQVAEIHSEYGMTEMFSQAYIVQNEVFECSPWMRVRFRDLYDPLAYVAEGKSGGMNIVDLANLSTCSFIATDDLGKSLGQNKFQVLGRIDNSDLRGCNLMVE